MNCCCMRVRADDSARFRIDQVIVAHAELAAMAGWLEKYMRAV